MSAHALYVTAAYGITAIVLVGLIGWILIDQRGRKRELAELEAAGVRRRSDKPTRDGAGKDIGIGKP
jgi:heme exporter protein D